MLSKPDLILFSSKASLRYDLSFTGVEVDIRGTSILKGVNGYAAQGQVLAVLGPSGKLETPAIYILPYITV